MSGVSGRDSTTRRNAKPHGGAAAERRKWMEGTRAGYAREMGGGRQGGRGRNSFERRPSFVACRQARGIQLQAISRLLTDEGDGAACACVRAINADGIASWRERGNGRETVRSFITLSSPLAPRVAREDDGTIIGGVPRSEIQVTRLARVSGRGGGRRERTAAPACPSSSRVQQERSERRFRPVRFTARAL